MADRISEKSGIACLLFLIFLSCLGIHRMYVGKVGTGILYLLTLGGFGIWWLIDLILLLAGAFTDQNGAKVKLSN